MKDELHWHKGICTDGLDVNNCFCFFSVFSTHTHEKNIHPLQQVIAERTHVLIGRLAYLNVRI